MRLKSFNTDERGAALLEFTIAAVVFLTATFAVLEFGRLLWTHNALSDAARRGARYAINHDQTKISDVQRVAVYGTTDDGVKPLVNGLTPDNVAVRYTGFNVGEGTVTVTIENYDFNFVVPIIGRKIRMPPCTTTLVGENAGEVPPDL